VRRVCSKAAGTKLRAPLRDTRIQPFELRVSVSGFICIVDAELQRRAHGAPLSSEHGTHKTNTAGFLPWVAGMSLSNLLSRSKRVDLGL